MTVGMTYPQLHAFGRSIFWHCPNECADLPALFRMFKRPNVRAEKLLFRISENMLNRGSDIANDTVRHDNQRGDKGVGQEGAEPHFQLPQKRQRVVEGQRVSRREEMGGP